MLESHLKEVYDYCSEPRRTRDIAEHFGLQLKTAQWRVGKLRKKGCLAMHRTKAKGSKNYECLFTQLEIQEPKVNKPYVPQGICVFGVWF